MATLLHYPLDAFSRSIRLALGECGVEVELVEEQPWEWRPEFLQINPAGTLPVLIADEHGPIVGAYAISEYLSDIMSRRDGHEAPGFRLFPGDARARAEARRLVDWFHRKFHDEVTAYLVEEKVFRRFGPQSASPDMEAMRAGPRESALSSRLYRPSRRDAGAGSRGDAIELRRSCRGGASLGARLSRRGSLGGPRGRRRTGMRCSSRGRRSGRCLQDRRARASSRQGLMPISISELRAKLIKSNKSWRRR